MVDSIAQYIKNITQFGILLVINLNTGAIAQEKERGTPAMLLVKPVQRSMVILAKMLVGKYEHNHHWAVFFRSGMPDLYGDTFGALSGYELRYP